MSLANREAEIFVEFTMMTDLATSCTVGLDEGSKLQSN